MGPFGSNIKRSNFDDGVPVIRGGNLTAGFVDENFVYLTEQKADELHKSNIFPEEIVITHRGTLGQVGIIPANSRFPVVSQSQMLISIERNLTTPRYIYDYLISHKGRMNFLQILETGVPAISRPTSSNPLGVSDYSDKPI